MKKKKKKKVAYLVNKSFEPEMKVITFNEQWVTMATEDDRHDTTFTATQLPHSPWECSCRSTWVPVWVAGEPSTIKFTVGVGML